MRGDRTLVGVTFQVTSSHHIAMEPIDVPNVRSMIESMLSDPPHGDHLTRRHETARHSDYLFRTDGQRRHGRSVVLALPLPTLFYALIMLRSSEANVLKIYINNKKNTSERAYNLTYISTSMLYILQQINESQFFVASDKLTSCPYVGTSMYTRG